MKISLERIDDMDEKKCESCKQDSGVYSFPVKEEKTIGTWLNDNRKVIFTVACCVISYKLGHSKGKQEALSIIDNFLKDVKNNGFDIGKF